MVTKLKRDGIDGWLVGGVEVLAANTNTGWRGVHLEESKETGRYQAYLTKSEAGDALLVGLVRPGSNTGFDLGGFDDPRKAAYAAAFYRINKGDLLPQYSEWRRMNPNKREPLFDALALSGAGISFPADITDLPFDPNVVDGERIKQRKKKDKPKFKKVRWKNPNGPGYFSMMVPNE